MEPRAVPARYAGRRVLVTGGARGIGAAVCRRMAAEGAEVVVADLDGEGAQLLAGQLPGGTAVRLDHCDEASVTEVFNRLGHLDVLVSNAGLALPDRRVLDYDVATFRQLLDVNLVGHFLAIRAAAPLLRTSRGVVVITASITGRRAQPGAGVYGAAKAGLLYLSRVLALELAPEVRVVTVSPAGVDTPLLREVAGDSVAYDAQEGNTPLGPLGQPEDVAAAISYAASGDGRHLTGTDIVVDGGTIAGG